MGLLAFPIGEDRKPCEAQFVMPTTSVSNRSFKVLSSFPAERLSERQDDCPVCESRRVVHEFLAAAREDHNGSTTISSSKVISSDIGVSFLRRFRRKR